jgi:subtilisin family serine protease
VNRKIVEIFVVMLLIGTAIPTFGMISEIESLDYNELKGYFIEEYVPGELIVKFKEPPFSSVSINNLNEKFQVISMEKLFKNPENTILDNIYILKFPVDSDILSILNYYTNDPNVIYAEINGFASLCLDPNDPDFDKQWHLENTGQTGGKADCDIDVTKVWDKTTGNSDILIAFVDTGVDYNHPDLADNIWINEDEIPDNEIDDDNNGYIDDIRGWNWWNKNNDIYDEIGHGTHCVGIAGAVGNNGIGVAGVAWNCKLMCMKLSDYELLIRYTDIAQSIEYATDEGANIISISMRFDKDIPYLKDAIDYAYDRGVVLIASAGNADTSIGGFPASYDNVIAVAGTDHSDKRLKYYYETADMWVYSSYGSWVDVAAPAEEIYSTMPTYHVYYNDYFGISENYGYMSGTSMSAPLVAGVAALMLSENSSLTPDEIKSNIKTYVDRYNSLYNLGTGRVNAYRAVEKAKSMDYINHWVFRLIQRIPLLEKILNQIIYN